MEENKNTWPAWISVKDHLPPNKDFVLACVTGIYQIDTPTIKQHITFERACVIASWYGEGKGNGWELDGYPDHNPNQLKVTHWMELPEPPKKGGDEDG